MTCKRNNNVKDIGSKREVPFRCLLSSKRLSSSLSLSLSLSLSFSMPIIENGTLGVVVLERHNDDYIIFFAPTTYSRRSIRLTRSHKSGPTGCVCEGENVVLPVILPLEQVKIVPSITNYVEHLKVRQKILIQSPQNVMTRKPLDKFGM